MERKSNIKSDGTTDLAVPEITPPSAAANQIAIFNHADQTNLMTTIKTSFAKGVNIFRDLERIKNPTSGGHTFKVQGIDGEQRLEKIVGIIVAQRDARTYFSRPYGSGPVGPPDCSSNDGITGHGDPGGECATCKFAQFGSRGTAGNQSRGSACRQVKQLLILRSGGGVLPEVMNVTPGSLNQITPYIRRLLNYGFPFFSALTEISLASEKNESGIEYSQLRFRKLPDELSEEQKRLAKEYYDIFQPALHNIDLAPSDYAQAG